MVLWEAGGYVAENGWEAFMLWTEFTAAGSLFAIGLQFILSSIIVIGLCKFINEGINN